MTMTQEEMIVFGGSASKRITRAICDYLKLEEGSLDTYQFSDGETCVKINNNIRGKEVYVIQSTSYPTNDNLMELLMIIDALKRASAGSINAVIPYFGYARQDRKDKPRVSLTAKLVANLITVAGANRVITVDLHASQIQGFFDIPVDHLYASPVIIEYIKEKMRLGEKVVVSPDAGNVKMSRAYAEKLGCSLAIVDKRRPTPNVAEIMNIIGDIKGKSALVFDDIIDTAGTIVNAAIALLENGAKDVYAFCTHPVLSGSACEKINSSPIKKLIVTDTINMVDEKKVKLPKMEIISVAPLIAEAISRIHKHQSVSSLFT